MKKRKAKKFLIIVLILIVLFFVVIFLKSFYNLQTIDDFLFLKLNSEANSDNENYKKNINLNNEYRFSVRYKKSDYKTVNLIDTKNKETLINEKIAPGTSGCFDIILNSNQNLKYRVVFKSENKKPQNLKFKASINGKFLGYFNTLDEMSEKISGVILKEEEIIIEIGWCWDFENNNKNEQQDTEDAKNISMYKFNIYVIGEDLYNN